MVLTGLEDGTVALTTDTTVALNAFMEGAMVTTPTVVVTRPEVDDVFEVVTVASAAIAPEPLTVVTDVVPEVLEVVLAPAIVDLITGATTAVTTVAVVLAVPDPKLPTELTEFDVVLPTAATTDVDDLITDESDIVDEAKDLDNSTAEENSVPVEHDCEISDETRVACDVAITEEDELLSTPEVLAPAVTGLVIPYGLGAKQHIICALDDDDLAPLKVASSCLSVVTGTVEVFPAEDTEFDVTRTLPGSPSWTADVSLTPGSTGTTPSTLSTGCWTGWVISATRFWAFGVHMSKPKHPIFAGMSRTTSPIFPSDDRDIGWPLTPENVSVQSQEVLSGVEII